MRENNLDPSCENRRSLFEFSLWLSRAWLGKKSLLCINGSKKTGFAHRITAAVTKAPWWVCAEPLSSPVSQPRPLLAQRPSPRTCCSSYRAATSAAAAPAAADRGSPGLPPAGPSSSLLAVLRLILSRAGILAERFGPTPRRKLAPAKSPLFFSSVQASYMCPEHVLANGSVSSENGLA
jgi:hypothetical protein